MRKFSFLFLMFMVSFHFSLYAGHNETPPVTTSFKAILKRNIQAEPDTFDPHKIWGIHGLFGLRDALEGLTTLSPDNQPIPAVAEKWEINPEGTEYIFSLRKTAKWSDGSPVTAHNFVYSWRRCVNPKTASQKASFFHPFVNADKITKGELPPEALGVEAIDNHTLKVKLNLPTPSFLTLMAHYIFLPLKQSSVEKHGDKFSRPGNFLCNGAFVLNEWQPQDYIKFVKNKHYWNQGEVKLEEVFYYPIDNQAVVLKRYQAGSLDITYDIPENQVGYIQTKYKNELHTGPYFSTAAYGVNLLHAPFKDNPSLRQALSLAIDRDALVKKVIGGGEIPAYTWVHPSLKDIPQNTLDIQKMTQAEREAEALKLYEKAGYSKENPFQFQLRFDSNERHKKVAIAISSMWSRVLGVKCQLINEELKVFLQNRRLKQVTQVFRNFIANETGDPFHFIEFFLSTSPLNTTGYNNSQFDELVKKALSLSENQERYTLLSQAEKLLLEDLPVLPLYQATNKRLIKPYVKGYKNSLLDYVYSKDLWIDEELYKKYYVDSHSTSSVQ
jgi:oligopeptide transport system substrate-binding protein